MKPWKPPSDLFWFLKEDAVLDLDRPGDRTTAVQHVLDRGGEKEVRELIELLGPERFVQTVREMIRFLHPRVRPFWQAIVGPIDSAPAENPRDLLGSPR